jgi:hypothetical protein
MEDRPPSSQPDLRKRRDFLIGMGLVAVPVALSLVAGGLLASGSGFNQATGTGITLGLASGALYLVTLVVMIILFFVRGTRQVALGMLAAAAIGPVVSYIGCMVITRVAHPAY